MQHFKQSLWMVILGMRLLQVTVVVAVASTCGPGYYDNGGQCVLCAPCPKHKLSVWIEDSCRDAFVWCPNLCRQRYPAWKSWELATEAICYNLRDATTPKLTTTPVPPTEPPVIPLNDGETQRETITEATPFVTYQEKNLPDPADAHKPKDVTADATTVTIKAPWPHGTEFIELQCQAWHNSRTMSTHDVKEVKFDKVPPRMECTVNYCCKASDEELDDGKILDSKEVTTKAAPFTGTASQGKQITLKGLQDLSSCKPYAKTCKCINDGEPIDLSTGNKSFSVKNSLQWNGVIMYVYIRIDDGEHMIGQQWISNSGCNVSEPTPCTCMMVKLESLPAVSCALEAALDPQQKKGILQTSP